MNGTWSVRGRPATNARLSRRAAGGARDGTAPAGPAAEAPRRDYAEPKLRRPAPRPETGSVSIVRSSGAMAVGTLGSRLTGFLRTIVQNAAFGVAGVAAAYNLSNTLPNVVYNLALGGILTSVIVPLIVNASTRIRSRPGLRPADVYPGHGGAAGRDSAGHAGRGANRALVRGQFDRNSSPTITSR